jgi:hypothetical protein
MDEKSQKMLAEIVAKQPAELTEADAAFLRARSSYLSEEQRALFAEALKQPEANQPEEGEKAEKDSKEKKK